MEAASSGGRRRPGGCLGHLAWWWWTWELEGEVEELEKARIGMESRLGSWSARGSLLREASAAWRREGDEEESHASLVCQAPRVSQTRAQRRRASKLDLLKVWRSAGAKNIARMKCSKLECSARTEKAEGSSKRRHQRFSAKW